MKNASIDLLLPFMMTSCTCVNKLYLSMIIWITILKCKRDVIYIAIPMAAVSNIFLIKERAYPTIYHVYPVIHSGCLCSFLLHPTSTTISATTLPVPFYLYYHSTSTTILLLLPLYLCIHRTSATILPLRPSYL